MINACSWEEIPGFTSMSEYKRFCIWLEEQIRDELIEKIPVNEMHNNATDLKEYLYRCKETGEIWRLVEPNFPFRGVWLPVENACLWGKIEGFTSLNGYKQFCLWIAEQIKAGIIEEVPIERGKGFGVAFAIEHWYRCKKNGEIWQLIRPDPPFRGLWRPVK